MVMEGQFTGRPHVGHIGHVGTRERLSRDFIPYMDIRRSVYLVPTKSELNIKSMPRTVHRPTDVKSPPFHLIFLMSFFSLKTSFMLLAINVWRTS